jgi:hypothetical protein
MESIQSFWGTIAVAVVTDMVGVCCRVPKCPEPRLLESRVLTGASTIRSSSSVSVGSGPFPFGPSSCLLTPSSTVAAVETSHAGACVATSTRKRKGLPQRNHGTEESEPVRFAIRLCMRDCTSHSAPSPTATAMWLAVNDIWGANFERIALLGTPEL